MRKAPKDYKGKKLALLERLAVAAERTVKIGTHAVSTLQLSRGSANSIRIGWRIWKRNGR